jgi:uncharacterized membrane protein YfcA
MRILSVTEFSLFIATLCLFICETHGFDVSAATVNATVVKDEVKSLLKEGDHVFEESHNSLFPLETSDYLGFFACLVGLMLAAGGGIGGGGILIPIYILVMGFTPKHAIPLSNVTVLGGAIANIILNARQRHPLVDRPLIDWYLILVMEPVTIAGAIIGTWINSILNETVIVILLILLLAFTARKTLKKAIKMHQKESQEQREQEKLASNAELTPLAKQKQESMHEKENGNGETNEELLKILEEEHKTPLAAVAVLVALFLVVLAINLAKGGGAFESPLGIECGSTGFWIANASILVAIAVCTVLVRAWLVRRFETKRRVGYEYVDGDIEWDSRATVVYPTFCALAGLFAGMFGIGGGIVKGTSHRKLVDMSSVGRLFISF